MKLAVCSQQRDRAPYLEEWIRFHHSQGVDLFYIYLHQCQDHSLDVVRRLSGLFQICYYTVGNLYQSQLESFNHCLHHHGHSYDWCAYIDGDEFLFAPYSGSIKDQIYQYQYLPLSGLAVYWAVFGSSHHVREPLGPITANYRYRASLDHPVNGHYKTILRGHQGRSVSVSNCSHYFHTSQGIFDTEMRSVSDSQWLASGHLVSAHRPCHDLLRINHYATQSRQYFLEVKQHQGSADQLGFETRSQAWWEEFDQNAEWDHSLDMVSKTWTLGKYYHRSQKEFLYDQLNMGPTSA